MKIAVFIDNFIHQDMLDSIKKYFLKENPYSSVFIANLHALQVPLKDIAIVNQYHLKWNNSNGVILFLNINDALANVKNFQCEKQLLISKEEIGLLTKDILDNCKILIRNKTNQIRKAKNAELQSIIRH